MGAEWYIHGKLKAVFGTSGAWVPDCLPHEQSQIGALFYKFLADGAGQSLLLGNNPWVVQSAGFRAGWVSGGWLDYFGDSQKYYLTRTTEWEQGEESGSFSETYSISYSVENGFEQTLGDPVGDEPDYELNWKTVDRTYSGPISSAVAGAWNDFSNTELAPEDYTISMYPAGSGSTADGPSGEALTEDRYRYKVGCVLSNAAAEAYDGLITFLWEERELPDGDSFSSGQTTATYSDEISEPRYSEFGLYADVKLEDLPWVAILTNEVTYSQPIRRVLPGWTELAQSIFFLPEAQWDSDYEEAVGLVFFGSGPITIRLIVTIYGSNFRDEEVEIEITPPTDGTRITDITAQVQAAYDAISINETAGEFDVYGPYLEIIADQEISGGFVSKLLIWDRYGFEDAGARWRTKVLDNNNWTVTETIAGHPIFNRINIGETVVDKRPGIITGKSASPVTVETYTGATKRLLTADFELAAAADKKKRLENLRIKIGDREFG